MRLACIFVICLSLAAMSVLILHTWKNRAVPGASAYMYQLIFVALWTVGTLAEMLSGELAGKLFWRNVQQIGAFSVPLTCLCFALAYTNRAAGKKYLIPLLAIPSLALPLYFFDPALHVMREGYWICNNPVFGAALCIRLAPLGLALSFYNFGLVFASVAILALYAARADRGVRLQTLMVVSSMLFVLIFAVFRAALFLNRGYIMPLAALYMPGSMVVFYNLFGRKLFHVTPIARDKVFDVIDQGIVVADGFGTIVDRNPFAVHLLGAFFGIGEELNGKRMGDVFGAYPKWVDFILKNSFGELEVEISDGCPHFFRIKVYPLHSENDLPIGTVSIIRDITARRLQESALKNKAEMDGLTGLLNRDGFLNAFGRILGEAEGTGELVSVLMMDLDRFKNINDTFGHIIGDRVLVLFAEMLRSVLRQKDAICRIGGDEFAAVLPGTGRAEAMAVAHRIRRKAEERVIEAEGGAGIRFTLSIGVCDSENVKQAADMLKCADRAMYEAKRKDRNCCVVWEQDFV